MGQTAMLEPTFLLYSYLDYNNYFIFIHYIFYYYQKICIRCCILPNYTVFLILFYFMLSCMILQIKICQSSQIFISMCFPRALAYFSNTIKVGTLPPLSKRARFDGLIPVISEISCCVIFWLCLSSTRLRIVSADLFNTVSCIFSV